MAKLYKMTVVAVDQETNEEEIVLDDTYKGFALSATCDDDRAAEVIVHDSIMDIANRFAQGKNLRTAVRLANVLLAMKRDDAENAENDLLRAIMEG